MTGKEGRRIDMRERIAIITASLLLLLCSIVFASDEWQTDIKVSVLNAENRLTIGQRPNATDGIDGRYDIPAFLAGDIQAYIELEGQKYWKDIRSETGNKTWNFFVESELTGEYIQLRWNPAQIPSDVHIMLTDTATGTAIDMKSRSSYSYANAGERQFVIEAKREM
jgi:hypothetical protein